ncbi:MAG: DAK2 domain-containing protein [Christensenellaceae bacterium]|nr:DAK2 domain-containing protein [Christensenellaceae bacterium]MDD6938913.1 DAK2 domain-containing protein [Christensenellaceae bacterium]MDY2747444.1 DAK2 domain-containing protein [Eubacteriales bacterium]
MTIGGAMLKEMFLTGAALIEKNRAYIDSLNVFPVPDGDTGTNMSMTMQSAVKEIQNCKGTNVSDIAAAASLGALKGARGNSGVILSQILRGFARALSGKEEMAPENFAAALTAGTEAAYKAVMKPKEGTMLTVARMMAEAVTKEANEGANLYKLIDVMIDEGERALLLTPELLPVLKEAGVVDSGGKGLVTILRGFKMVIDGEDVDEYVLAPQMQDTAGITGGEEGADLEALDDIEFGYCTEFFIIHLDESFSEADLDKLREKLMKIGDSVVVAYDSDFIKIHVHSNCPGKILQLALRLGEIDRIKIENMREQNRELLANMKKNEKENALVAVSISDGIDEVYKAIGVNNLISGGQTMNPSIDSITKAIRRANARNVFVLPNNSNIIMAAQQAAAISDRNVIVIPSKTMMQGLSAALAYSDDVDVETNTERMTAAIKQVLSGSVTYAVRDTQFNGEKISQGDIIGLLDNVITKVGTSVDSVAVELLCSMIENKGDDCMATIFYGEGADEDSAQAVADAVNEKYPDAEITVQYGGQPLYYYYFSVE